MFQPICPLAFFRCFMPEHCEYNNKDEANNPNILNNNNYQASSQKFKLIKQLLITKVANINCLTLMRQSKYIYPTSHQVRFDMESFYSKTHT